MYLPCGHVFQGNLRTRPRRVAPYLTVSMLMFPHYEDVKRIRALVGNDSKLPSLPQPEWSFEMNQNYDVRNDTHHLC